MKYISIIASFLLISFFTAHAQMKVKSISLINSGINALPGEDYGLGLTVPPIIFDPGPAPHEPNEFDDDISIELLRDSTGLILLQCPDHFKVFYHIKVKSAEVLHKGHFRINVSVPGLPDQVKWLVYDSNNDNLTIANAVSGNFNIKYAYIYEQVKGHGWVKRYYRHPYSISAVTDAGFIGGGSTTLILDPNRTNNQESLSFLSPLPPNCPAHLDTEKTK